MAKFDKSVLAKYGITDVQEVLYNPTYEVLFNEETKDGLEGFDVGQETELGAINVMARLPGRSVRMRCIRFSTQSTRFHSRYPDTSAFSSRLPC